MPAGGARMRPPRHISAGRHEARDILRCDLSPQPRPQFREAKFAEIIVEITAGRARG